jgi:hypothetical protein
VFQQNSFEKILSLRKKLNSHPIYESTRTLSDLRIFMSHHVYSVWDFMSLSKFLQNHFAPSNYPWAPGLNNAVRRFINQIILEEESDLALPDMEGNSTYASHFEIYCRAMEEVGADASVPIRFARFAGLHGFNEALNAFPHVPAPAKLFMRKTFAFIDSAKPHVVAAAFAFGREQIIPSMFRNLLASMSIDKTLAPTFHYYLERHIHLDEDQHGPLALQMLNCLCEANPQHVTEAEIAAQGSIQSRIRFWDEVSNAITNANETTDRKLSADYGSKVETQLVRFPDLFK